MGGPGPFEIIFLEFCSNKEDNHEKLQAILSSSQILNLEPPEYEVALMITGTQMFVSLFKVTLFSIDLASISITRSCNTELKNS
jgi:hypothetical protein